VLGAFLGASGVVSDEKVRETVQKKMARKKELLAGNLKVLQDGYRLALKELGQKKKAMA
jgi:Pyruvate/2-oxoacid:ferredoxin oxidoreductase gamma subunit